MKQIIATDLPCERNLRRCLEKLNASTAGAHSDSADVAEHQKFCAAVLRKWIFGVLLLPPPLPNGARWQFSSGRAFRKQSRRVWIMAKLRATLPYNLKRYSVGDPYIPYIFAMNADYLGILWHKPFSRSKTPYSDTAISLSGNWVAKYSPYRL